MGPRKREVGLVDPARYTAFTKECGVATVLSNEILKWKNTHSHFELQFDKKDLIWFVYKIVVVKYFFE